MKDKTVLITGSTDGIGKQTAIDLAVRDFFVIVQGRNKDRTLRAVEEISNNTKSNKIDYVIADLSSFKQTRQLAEEIKSKHNRLDVLINNAGVYMKTRSLTEDGLETTFQVNHLSHFLLTILLLDLIKNSTKARIINVSSVAHMHAELDFDNLQGEKHYDAYNAYAVSKLANILFTYRLAEKLKDTGITVNALHPGVIGTKLLWEGFSISGASVKQGAETSVYLASSPDVENVTGKYFVDKKETPSSGLSYDKHIQNRMWEISAKLTGVDL